MIFGGHEYQTKQFLEVALDWISFIFPIRRTFLVLIKLGIKVHSLTC